MMYSHCYVSLIFALYISYSKQDELPIPDVTKLYVKTSALNLPSGIPMPEGSLTQGTSGGNWYNAMSKVSALPVVLMSDNPLAGLFNGFQPVYYPKDPMNPDLGGRIKGGIGQGSRFAVPFYSQKVGTNVAPTEGFVTGTQKNIAGVPIQNTKGAVWGMLPLISDVNSAIGMSPSDIYGRKK